MLRLHMPIPKNEVGQGQARCPVTGQAYTPLAEQQLGGVVWHACPLHQDAVQRFFATHGMPPGDDPITDWHPMYPPPAQECRR